jgi:ribose transport system ATP-binding protein
VQSESGNTLLSVRGVSKIYPGTRALDDVDLEIRSGEIHALVGGNGCGKSTLIKILTGVVEADGGTVKLGDQVVEASKLKPALVRDLGIRVVHQDLAVFPGLSVAENLRLGTAYPTTGFGQIRWRALRQGAREAIGSLQIPAKPGDLVGNLPIAIRAQVAIARALQGMSDQSGLIIFDEATASLPAHEVQVLFKAVRRLAAAGHSVLFVSHRLDEVLELTDRVTVLRDGKVVAQHRTAELTEQELIASILGDQAAKALSDNVQAPLEGASATGETSAVRARRPSAGSAAPVLEVTGLRAGPLREVNLCVRAGEVVGVAGLLGSGRSELLRAIYGDLRVHSGSIALNGRRVAFRHAQEAIEAGVILIPEDRSNGALFPDFTVDENLTMGVIGRYWKGGWFRQSRITQDADALRAQFGVKTPTGSVPITALSGGNQQKVVLGRWLRRNPNLLLLDEPSQGVDVGARADIYKAVRRTTDAGSAAIVVTSDLEELAQVVDRAVVLYEGRIVAEIAAHELSAQRLNEMIYERGKHSHV